jgi:hypothetical protein
MDYYRVAVLIIDADLPNSITARFTCKPQPAHRAQIARDYPDHNIGCSSMSRRSKRPVGFATHITAGGLAGACEAVRLSVITLDLNSSKLFAARVPTSRYHQSPYAVIQVRSSPWGESIRL